MSPEDRTKLSSQLEALRSCQQCGAEAAWGILDEEVAYCEDHAPWVDHDLAALVNRSVEPLALADWLGERPESWRAKQETFGKELTAENRAEFKEWLRTDRGDCVLVAYLEDAVRRTDLRVNPPTVYTLDGDPITHLPPWAERFSEMLEWWTCSNEGAGRVKLLEVLDKAVELEELAAKGPIEAMVAKGRESEAMPPAVMKAAAASYDRLEQRNQPPSEDKRHNRVAPLPSIHGVKWLSRGKSYGWGRYKSTPTAEFGIFDLEAEDPTSPIATYTRSELEAGKKRFRQLAGDWWAV